jgi:hypothetical protein
MAQASSMRANAAFLLRRDCHTLRSSVDGRRQDKNTKARTPRQERQDKNAKTKTKTISGENDGR